MHERDSLRALTFTHMLLLGLCLAQTPALTLAFLVPWHAAMRALQAPTASCP